MKFLYLKKNKNKGVNLIELLVSLSVISIMTMIASPSISSWVGNTAVKSTAENIASGINLGRSEAIKLNKIIEVNIDENGGWKIIDVADDNTINQGVNDKNTKTTLTFSPTGATKISFNGLGMTVPNSDETVSLNAILVKNKMNKEIAGSNVYFGEGGAVSVCSYQKFAHNSCTDVIDTSANEPAEKEPEAIESNKGQ